MQSPLSESSAVKYRPLYGTEENDRPRETYWYSSKLLSQLLLIVSAIANLLLLGLLVWRNSSANTAGGLLLPPGTILEVWQHNLTFSQTPTPESEAAWSSIVPVGRGFVHHPDIAPFISNIAVFHQLHCLHGVRVAYYTTLHELESARGSAAPDPYLETLGARTDNVHMRHCFDYLRHALMCAADTNLEGVSRETHVTTGWGSKRQCRDYAAVKAWAEQWRNSSDTGIL